MAGYVTCRTRTRVDASDHAFDSFKEAAMAFPGHEDNLGGRGSSSNLSTGAGVNLEDELGPDAELDHSSKHTCFAILGFISDQFANCTLETKRARPFFSRTTAGICSVVEQSLKIAKF
jgi:hypothetical protein